MDQFERLWKMGAGGQGNVYRVKHKKTSKEYALKIIGCRDEAQVNFALKEIKVLMELRHPNIVSYYDFFLQFDKTRELSVCLQMELCSCGDLQEKIREGKRYFMEKGKSMFEERRIVRWICQCALALDFIHSKGFLHRDLKPTNLFFSSNDDVRLGDFGLATAVELGRQTTVGTPYYFAPELMLRETYNDKVDIWGLGVVLLELMTLKERPINSEVLSNPNAADSVVEDLQFMGFSSLIGTLVRDMLSRYPDGRPSPKEILKRLENEKGYIGTATAPLSSRASFRQKPPPLSDPTTPVTPLLPVATPLQGPSCDLCGVATPSVSCADCGECFCVACDALYHRASARSLHDRSAMPSSCTARAAAGVKCNVCCLLWATIKCAGCGESGAMLCAGCDALVHKNVRRAGHDREPIGSRVTTSPTMAEEHVPPPGVAMFTKKPLAPEPPKPKPREPLGKRTGNVPPPPPPATKSKEDKGVIDAAAKAGTATEQVPQEPVGTPVLGSGTMLSPVAGSTFRVPQDHATITQAIHAAVDGDRIVVGPGQYNEALVIKKNIELCGVDEGTVIIEVSGANAVTLTSERGRLSKFSIRQVRSPSGTDNGSAKYLGIDVRCGQWVIDHCTVVSQTGACIGVTGDADPTVSYCTVREGRQAGLYIFEGGRGTYQRNNIVGNDYAGILVKRNAAPKVMDNSICDGKETGIFVCHNSQGIYENNTITNNRGCGVVIKAHATPVVRRNKIFGNKQAGIFCCDSGGGTIADNEISTNSKAGVLVKTRANPTIIRNKIQGGRETGVYVFEHGEGTIQDNDISGNANAGLLVTTGGNPVCTGNKINRNQYEGVWVCKGGLGHFDANDLRFNLKGAKDVESLEALRWVNNIEK